MNDEEKKYNELIEDLKNLPKINAPQNFETDLWRKIDSSESKKRESFWENLFSTKRIVPAAVAISSAVIIFFIIDIKSTQVEDPLNMQPRMREDVILVKDYDDIEMIQEKPELNENPQKDLIQEKPESKLRSNEREEKLNLRREKSQIKENTITEGVKPESLMKKQSGAISDKIQVEASSAPEAKSDNFNFMQIRLSEKQKKEVEQLKQRLQSSERAKSGQN